MALLFPQSAGLAPVPQRWMLVGSSPGGAPSSCAAAHDTSKRQQSNTPQEKVAFFTRTSSFKRIAILSNFVRCNQTANLSRWSTAKLFKTCDLFVNCIAHQAAILDQKSLLRLCCKSFAFSPR